MSLALHYSRRLFLLPYRLRQPGDEADARRRARGLIWGTGLNSYRCTKAQNHLKIPPKSFPPSILLWLPPVRPMTSAANDGN